MTTRTVAVTRAQALLIVVGDPETLGCDALFRSFINYVYNAGGYKGVAPSWDTKREVVEDPGALIEERRDEAMNELEALVSKLNLSDEQVEAEAMAVQAEQPWRRADE